MDESAAASDAKQDAAASSASSPSSSSSDAIARARSLFANRFCVLRSLCSPPHTPLVVCQPGLLCAFLLFRGFSGDLLLQQGLSGDLLLQQELLWRGVAALQRC